MRSIWSGSLSFGLINIPVKIYTAAEERGLKFRMLDRHGYCPVSYAKVCRTTNKEIKYEDIVKGYEYRKGDYIIFTDEDLRKIAPKKTKTIDILSFTKEDEVPSVHIDKPYFVEPDPKAEKAYVLLRETLKRSGTVGVASWVLRNKQNLAMVKPEGNALILVQLRYASELRKPEGLNLPASADYSEKEIDMALALVRQLEEHFDASTYRDDYTEKLKKLIDERAQGKTIHVEEAEGTPAATDMRDLMAALRESLEKERVKAGRT